MELAGVDHQLGDPAEPLERHVELLGVNDRDVPVLFSAQDQRRRCDVLHPVEGLHFLPHLAVLPRQAELDFPPALILVVAVVGNVDEGAGAGAGPLEPVGPGDHVVGQLAAVRPAADPEPVGVAVSPCNHVVDRRHHVLVGDPFQVLPSGHAEGLAIAGGAARVGHHHHVARSCEELTLETEAVVVLRLGPAVDLEHHRVPEARVEARRLDDEALDCGAVPAGELDMLHLPQPKTVEQIRVGVGQLPQIVSLQYEDLGWQLRP
ncbi:hypothetical protein ES703_24142 [subsurface metagenome]